MTRPIKAAVVRQDEMKSAFCGSKLSLPGVPSKCRRLPRCHISEECQRGRSHAGHGIPTGPQEPSPAQRILLSARAIRDRIPPGCVAGFLLRDAAGRERRSGLAALWRSDASGKSSGTATQLLLLVRPREEYKVPNRYGRHRRIVAGGQKNDVRDR